MKWSWKETVALKEHYKKKPMAELLILLQELNDNNKMRTREQVYEKVRDLRTRNGWKI